MPLKSTEANSTNGAESRNNTATISTQRKQMDWIASTWHASGTETIAPSSARMTASFNNENTAQEIRATAHP